MKILSQLTSQKYLIKNARLSSTEFEQFNSFFKARCGSNFALRFRNYADYRGINEVIAKGDGNLNKFQLRKIYGDPIAPYERVITKPVNNSVILYINNVRTMGIVDYNNGIVTLPSPLGQDVILTTDFTFDVAVRLSIDSFEYSYCNDGSIALYNIELVEVII
ncbi:phage distal tail protein, Rcc01695 family [Rickettsia sibirica]|uniref:phage distal tail protein, Rcc01695 family n=1 Tax=Rickettsia sibirica TaxID=35793 RepID=UPI0002EA0E14|nr:TIGR02217 family protein [Rickettsia sibirica]